VRYCRDDFVLKDDSLSRRPCQDSCCSKVTRSREGLSLRVIFTTTLLGFCCSKMTRCLSKPSSSGGVLSMNASTSSSSSTLLLAMPDYKVNEQMLLPPAATAETTIEADNALQPPYTVA
jgi:hypothetical protein